MKTEVTDLAGLIRLALDDFASKVHTGLPGAIVSYDASTKKASVQPLVQKRIWQGGVLTAMPLPVIYDVPVQFPGTPRAQISFDLQAGDTGMIMFSEVSLDAWLQSAGGSTQVDPQDDRRFDINDAVFIPGVSPFGAPGLPGISSGMLLQYGSPTTGVQLKLSGSGTISMLDASTGNPLTSDVTTDPTFWPILTTLAGMFGMTLTQLKAAFSKV